mgnify:CR=1 FL=1
MKVIIISAIAQNGVIGRANGEMPWHVKEEFQHFKNTTFGYPVIMGRKTFGTLGKPLKGRLNVVVTRQQDLLQESEDLKLFNKLESAVGFFFDKKKKKIFIIGGGEIYRQAITFAHEMILSFMKFSAKGEVLFPVIDEKIWKKELIESHDKFDIYKFERMML